ncbi:class I fructose-bisphosphate aldolase [Euzebya rosea]|uniref:class I fructose-bisphosphate aldolase n=1 Tax=Euzebya rosea TaxID=2052804 RepID=UPI00196A49C1|nr:class I fructose-bisphosphate aldolase [Euzebya rosea]
MPSPTPDIPPHIDLGELELQLRSMDSALPSDPRGPGRVRQTAAELVAPGKGILAADESNSTADARLAAFGASTGPEGRRAYRQMLLAADGLSAHVSGVILYDETLRQQADDGTPFATLLASRGIMPGVKVDTGTAPLAGRSGETITKGLDGLRTRLAEYVELGVRFAKWRATFRVDRGPSDACLAANVTAMAQYAALCQEAGVVPMVEPEVLMSGAHGLAAVEDASTRILHALYGALFVQGVDLAGTLLKVNMAVPGQSSTEQPSPVEVAEATLRMLRRTVPVSVPGVVFLSGGQSAGDATVRLDAISRAAAEAGTPWTLSFSYSRALQETVLTIWSGQSENVVAAQRQLVHRAACNGAASTGSYDPVMEAEGALAGAR